MNVHAYRDPCDEIDAIYGHPTIDRSFPFAELNDAVRLQKSGRHSGNVVAEL
ncbi:zinc-binding dehydrogenase [Asaia bogorensis]|uniref:zinc-binding dehydrogenase n=1 Tax=Asaia bogorensis TaxID=91915 RepID=UPI0013CE56F5|nr:zinc-binding dehydrogenase [Asaia bogorensis]